MLIQYILLLDFTSRYTQEKKTAINKNTNRRIAQICNKHFVFIRDLSSKFSFTREIKTSVSINECHHSDYHGNKQYVKAK